MRPEFCARDTSALSGVGAEHTWTGAGDDATALLSSIDLADPLRRGKGRAEID